MYRVIGSPPRHMAAHAVGSRFVRGYFGQRSFSLMASGANLVVVDERGLSTGDVVRIVATGTAKLTRTLQETLGFPQAVSGVCDLEAGIFTRLAIEVDLEVRQRLARPVGEWFAIQANDRVRQLLI